ncbi:hypothetical protein B0O99DRAFT_565028 [Bisporella sp. PMI_857]|nr:hypothetical protein B0O99DRAFT_565028 [Bisporella sp. PMI_857]
MILPELFNEIFRKREAKATTALLSIIKRIDVLLERFLDAHSPVMPYYSGASDLIRAAAATKTSSPILNMSFHSLCIVYYGQIAGNPGVVISGRRIYSKVLNTLQHALSSPEECRSIWVLLTVIVLTAYESLQHSSSGSIIKHFIGALKLLEVHGPSEHVSGLGNICYVQYRSHWVATALICRSRTFLADLAWKTIPWSTKLLPKDLMQSLLDHVADIPALLERYDSITKSLKTGVLSSFEASNQQKLLQAAVADTKRHFHQWEKEWVASYPSGHICDVPANTGDYLPNFRCRDSITREIITPAVFASRDPQLIRTMCIYYSALVILLGVDTQPDEITLPEKYHYACLICRSLEYYIREVPRGLMNGVGFFLRVAYDTFPKGDIELEWAEEAFKRIAKGKSTKAFGSMLSELSV